jgi:starch synthase
MGRVESVWIASREYAGIAEAGGVKNVARSLAEGLVRKGVAVTAFVPRYGCVEQSGDEAGSVEIAVAGTSHRVVYRSFDLHGVRVILVDSSSFVEKEACYTYTASEEGRVPGAVRGKGHRDTDEMNVLFQRAVIAWARLAGAAPDVIHCQDAHTAFLPALARHSADAPLFARTRFPVTIHNAGPGYRQSIAGLARARELTELPTEVLERAVLRGSVEPFLVAAEAGILTTVSPWYAAELMSSYYDDATGGLSGEFERRGIEVRGITNGIDFARYDPRDVAHSLLPFAFDPSVLSLEGKYLSRRRFLSGIAARERVDGIEYFGSLVDDPRAVYFSYHGRLAYQKGIDVLARAAEPVLAASPLHRFLVLGQGDPALETLLQDLAGRFPGQFAFVRGYERTLARLAVACSDFLVLPSAFEPCGLEDFIGQIYGTIPVARAVGGLKKIKDGATGFLYHSPENDPAVLARLLVDLAKPAIRSRAPGEGLARVAQYRRIIQAASIDVQENRSWDAIIAEEYLPLYSS